MYYKQRKMEAANQQFFYRVGQLPLVKAVSEKTISIYGTAKNSNRLVNATLGLAENSVKKASETEVVKKIFDNQVIAVANELAVQALNKAEQNYPIVTKTPEEVYQIGKDYYDHSFIKHNVDRVYSAKDYSVTKINDTKRYYGHLLAAILDNLLNASDSFVDQYIAVKADANGQHPHIHGNTTYINRFSCISGKAYYGLKYRAGEKYDITKEYVLQTLGDMHIAMHLIEYAKNSAAWTNEKARTTLTTAQEQAKALWHEIQHRAEPVTDRAEIVILRLVQNTALVLAALSQQVVKVTSPYLPENLEKPVAAGANYATDLRDTFAKANTLGELSNEVLAEAKQKLGYIQEGLVKGIDYLVENPSVNWMIPDRMKPHHNGNPVKLDNGYLDNSTHEHQNH